MLNFYKTIDGRIVNIPALEPGCWINVVSPEPEEISYLIDELGIDRGFVNSSIDEEESSRIEMEDDQTLIIVDTPAVEKQADDTMLYYTLPYGIVITDKYFVTISSRKNIVIDEISSGVVKNIQTNQKTRFLLTILLRISAKFLQYLKQIDKISSSVEAELNKSMKNQELIQLFGLEKSLVYFSTSLKGNQVTMEKILRGRIIKLYEEDRELLEDVIVEINQAIEMCSIYTNILSGTMDAFASIISNNLNIVMKKLTAVTIIMAIPTMIFSFYGMNTNLPLPFFWFPLALSGLITIIVAILFIKKNMFN